MKTAQDIFVEVVQRLAAQGERSDDGHNGCLYRGPNGRRCAAGWLIADEHYDETFNNSPSSDAEVRRALLLSGVLEEHLSLVRELQWVHDNHPKNGGWAQGFLRLARDHNLSDRVVYKAFRLPPGFFD